jgi:sodium/potassium-transporting ATPase subunit alpha
MHPHQLSVAEALASLHSRPDGVSHADAARRFRDFGPNRVEDLAREPVGRRLATELTHFLSLILWRAAGLAFVAEWSAPGQGMARLGYAIIGVILVSGLFSFWQEYRAQQTLMALRQLLPPQVDVLREGRVVPLPVEQLVPGDVVRLAQGDHLPADCRLIEAFGVRVDTATVTGESLPQARDAGPSEDGALIRGQNI